MSFQPRLTITAGPTHEPIDAVRFLGNRSSGMMGIALADAAADRGWRTTLLLGPTHLHPNSRAVGMERFSTCAQLEQLLARDAPQSDVLIMAAAVADFRPKPNPAMADGKFRRSHAALTLELEPTPDLLAGIAHTKRPEQVFVGFALEPRSDLLASGLRKLETKRVDMVVANPLETLNNLKIDATLLTIDAPPHTPGIMAKSNFANWLLDRIEAFSARPRQSRTPASVRSAQG